MPELTEQIRSAPASVENVFVLPIREDYLVNPRDQTDTVVHEQEISSQFMEKVFGRDVIADLRQTIQPGEYGYVKGGRLSLLINHSYIVKPETIGPSTLGDVDVAIFGKESLSRLKQENPKRVDKTRLVTHHITDGADVEYVNGEKIMGDITLAVHDACAQVQAYVESGRSLTDEQKKAFSHALGIAEQLKESPESVLMTKGLERSKEAAIKIVNEGGTLKYYFCDPNHTIDDSSIYNRDRTVDYMWSMLEWRLTLMPHVIPDISETSIHRLVMEMVTAFGNFDTQSPIVLSTVPLAMKLLQEEPVEGMTLAADGLKHVAEALPDEYSWVSSDSDKSIASFGLIRSFLTSVVNNPNFASITNDFMIREEGFQTLGEYTHAMIKQGLAQAFEQNIQTGIFLAVSYIPELIKLVSPELAKLPAIESHQQVFGEVIQNSLEGYLAMKIESPFIEKHAVQVQFFRNLMGICAQLYPQRIMPIFKGHHHRDEPGVWRQEKSTASINEVFAVILLAAGQQSPQPDTLYRLAAGWTGDSKTEIDTAVTAEGILEAINRFTNLPLQIVY